jgi:hypothetical protein
MNTRYTFLVLLRISVWLNLYPYHTSVVSAILFSRQQYGGSFQCENDDDARNNATTSRLIGPNFYGIPPATSKNESLNTIQDREYRLLTHYARISLPSNNSLDDYPDTLYVNRNEQPSSNPFLNSRSDTNQIVNRYISRILLGCYNNSDMDEIFLNDKTRPFAISGTSFRTKICNRDGDYDFATIDLLQFLYVSRQYPGSVPMTVYEVIRDKLLTINGTITSNYIVTPCQVNFGPLRRSILIKNHEDTENHILQSQISRYLSNQLLIEVYPNNLQFNNTANGNKVWMLQYLSSFLRDYFYEYNSRPYQSFTVKALTVLHSFALDTDIVLITEMILDLITAFSSMQMNHLRRFVPFRRQPKYKKETQSWKGESELYRLALLVGNYGTLDGPDYVLPKVPEEITSFGDAILISTVASNYQLKDFLWNMFYRDTPEYFVSNHHVVEMYYSTKNVLLSAGGNTDDSVFPRFTISNRFCFFNPCLLNGYFIKEIVEELSLSITNDEKGWSRPTTIIPSKEQSTDILDMIRFDGNRNFDDIFRSRNLCVAPGFACGLQLQYGKIIEPILDKCSTVMGDWRYLDFSGNGNNNAICPKYGYYMATYERSCIECNNKADNYGVLEISENVQTMTFSAFQEKVAANNPYPFESSGIQTYRRITGQAIQFEINPPSDDQSQIVQIHGVDDGDIAYNLDRNYRNMPMAWSANGSIQSLSAVGRWTFDSSNDGTIRQRSIYDVTDALHPRRLTSELPNLIKHKMINEVAIGKYFDDSCSVLYDDTLQSISFSYNLFHVSNVRTTWRRSQLQSSHGLIKKSVNFLQRTTTYTFQDNERIVTVGVGTATFLGKQRINRIRIVTNMSRSIIVGYGRNEQAIYNDNHIIAFYGRASDEMLHQLGVISISN